jgi:hypothetical protein
MASLTCQEQGVLQELQKHLDPELILVHWPGGKRSSASELVKNQNE